MNFWYINSVIIESRPIKPGFEATLTVNGAKFKAIRVKTANFFFFLPHWLRSIRCKSMGRPLPSNPHAPINAEACQNHRKDVLLSILPIPTSHQLIQTNSVVSVRGHLDLLPYVQIKQEDPLSLVLIILLLLYYTTTIN